MYYSIAQEVKDKEKIQSTSKRKRTGVIQGKKNQVDIKPFNSTRCKMMLFKRMEYN